MKKKKMFLRSLAGIIMVCILVSGVGAFTANHGNIQVTIQNAPDDKAMMITKAICGISCIPSCHGLCCPTDRPVCKNGGQHFLSKALVEQITHTPNEGQPCYKGVYYAAYCAVKGCNYVKLYQDLGEWEQFMCC
jgi:hypothetical protein